MDKSAGNRNGVFVALFERNGKFFTIKIQNTRNVGRIGKDRIDISQKGVGSLLSNLNSVEYFDCVGSFEHCGDCPRRFADAAKLSLPLLTVVVNGAIVIRPLSIFMLNSLLPRLRPIYSAVSNPKVVFALRFALNCCGAFLGQVLENHSESFLLPVARKPCRHKRRND